MADAKPTRAVRNFAGILRTMQHAAVFSNARVIQKKWGQATSTDKIGILENSPNNDITATIRRGTEVKTALAQSLWCAQQSAAANNHQLLASPSCTSPLEQIPFDTVGRFIGTRGVGSPRAGDATQLQLR